MVQKGIRHHFQIFVFVYADILWYSRHGLIARQGRVLWDKIALERKYFTWRMPRWWHHLQTHDLEKKQGPEGMPFFTIVDTPFFFSFFFFLQLPHSTTMLVQIQNSCYSKRLLHPSSPVYIMSCTEQTQTVSVGPQRVIFVCYCEKRRVVSLKLNHIPTYAIEIQK